MDNKLFSSEYEELKEKYYPEGLKQELDKTSKLFVDQAYKVFSYYGDIGISFSLSIPLPTRGTYSNVDIRETEPVFIRINSNLWKHQAPRAYSDRKDFPMSKLSHMNPVIKNSPPSFCLHRGSINEWYAEHTLSEYIGRIREWLRDASADRLIKLGQGDEFEITRIENWKGYIVYDYENFYKHSLNKDASFQFIMYEIAKDSLLEKENKSYSIKSNGILAEDKYQEARELFEDTNKGTQVRVTFGIFLYPEVGFESSEYFGEMPGKYSELVEFCSRINVDIEIALKEYLAQRLNLLKGIPVTIAIRRPRKLIGYKYNVEFLNFVVLNSLEKINDEFSINGDSAVSMLSNRKPITLELSKFLSNSELTDTNKTLVFGCGAVGSKLIMHLARGGLNNIIVVDDDKISPHNLVRHALFSGSVGKNKGEAIKKEIDDIYKAEHDFKFDSIEKKGEEFLKDFSPKDYQVERIIDSTASHVFQNYIADHKSVSKYVYRCEIAWNGNIGILKKEGKNRSPRLDDLTIQLYDRAVEDDFLASWLRQYYENIKNGGFEFEEINVGASCNSETVRMADDVISLHTALFSLGIKELEGSDSGFIYLTKRLNEHDSKKLITEKIEFGKVIEKCFDNDRNWQLRIAEESNSYLSKQLFENFPNETGGLLLGRIDFKRKIIYVTRVIDAPEDSIKKPYCFKRGVKDVPEILEKVRKRTGNMIDFVGEWHTHPGKDGSLSGVDKEAIRELRKSLDRIPYPTFILVVTTKKLHPYIFGQ